MSHVNFTSVITSVLLNVFDVIKKIGQEGERSLIKVGQYYSLILSLKETINYRIKKKITILIEVR